ncbi:MAG: carbohydrate ABC transporter permease [Anaerolineae bacterium]|nr:carbohydrate ABC transporter permease [Anaerolineae bacterium]
MNTSHKITPLQRILRRVPLYLLVIFACLITAFPIYWMVVSTVQPVEYSFKYPPPLFPVAIHLEPFTNLFQNFPIATWLLNTILLAGLTTCLCLALSVIGAYTLSALKWRGKNVFGLLLLVTQLLPEALIVIPLFAMYQKFGLRENIPALSLVDAAFVIPLGIWILKNVYDAIPPEIYDAARVDGCTQLGVLRRVALPLSVPGLVAVGVVAFFYAWNEYLFASNLITNAKLWPASVGMASLRSMIDTPIDKVFAAGMFFSIFPIIFYLIVQRYVVAGLSAGAVKG